MSKTFAKLFLFLFLIVTLWLQIFTKIAFAEQVFDVSKYGVKFTVKHAPERLYTDSSLVTITVTTNRDFFNSQANYAYKFQATKDIGCFSISDINRDKPENATTYKATLQLIGCRASPGEWTFSLAQIETGTTNKEELIPGYKFIIEQAGGQLPSLKPLDDPLRIGTKPSVALINPRTDNNYEFWWAGARKSFATSTQPITATSNDNIIIPLLEEEVSFNSPGEKILCMEVKKKGEWDRFPAGLSCSYRTTFHYQFNMAPPSMGCFLEPAANASTVDSISMRISNASSNIDIEGYLIQGTNQLNKNTAKTNDDGNALISLGNALPLGVYTTHILNSSARQPICSDQELTIGETGTTGAVPAPTPCTGDNCTKGGGENCSDNRGPAFKTAIGCVHTNPVEFVKDLMTWVIGIGGGLAFLMMLLGAFQMLTSAGNPETLAAGKDRLTSAVIGLLFVIFTMLLLQIIGFDILKIPGFGR